MTAIRKQPIAALPAHKRAARKLYRGIVRRTSLLLDRVGIAHSLKRDPWAKRLHQIHLAFRKASVRPRDVRPYGNPPSARFRNILIPDMEGVGPLAPFVEFTVATALRMRGARVVTLQCDGAPHCEIATVEFPMRPRCSGCARDGRRLIDAFGLDAYTLNALVAGDERRAIEDAVAALPEEALAEFSWDGIAIGRGVRHYLPNYFRTLDLDSAPGRADIERRSLVTSALVAAATKALLKKQEIDKVILFHGPTLTRWPIWEVARRNGIPVDTWEVTNRSGTVGFAHEANASHGILDKEWLTWNGIALTETEKARLDDYFGKRLAGKPPDTRVYQAENATADPDAIRAKYGLRPGHPLAVMFTNCSWDGAVLGRDRTFSSMSQWIEETIRHFADGPVDLLIRAHPGETVNGTRQPVDEEIRRAFPELPSNVKVIPASEPVLSYSLMRLASVGLVYSSTVGLEMALMGKPVVVVGDVHYRGKGFTLDPEDPERYRAQLEDLTSIPRPTEIQVEWARRYAYLRYFRWMIPFPYFTYAPREPQMGFFHLRDVADLAPGRDMGLDAICAGIQDGAPFLLEDPEGPSTIAQSSA